ncbi:MAG: CatB-related O-acetyltransferase [Solirubrobacterales bacterium]
MTTSDSSELKQSNVGRLAYRCFRFIPRRWAIVRLVTKLEGGEVRSATLRRVLREKYDIEVGAHSYGSLLSPDLCDPNSKIGRYVSIGPNVRRIGASHPLAAASLHPYWYNATFGIVDESADVERSPIEIGDDSWIGANVTILPRCTRVGIGAVIGAGAVVTRDVLDFEIVAGNPARSLGFRLTDETRQHLLDARPWELPPNQYRQFIAELPTNGA